MIRKSKMFKALSLCMAAVILSSVGFVGCSKTETKTEKTTTTDNTKKEESKQTLKFTIFSAEMNDTFNKLKLIESYKKVKPNVTIEIEKVKDSGEFENAMKIRKAANELPDIMPLKPYMLSNFKDILAPIDDIDAAKNNLYAKAYSIDGKTLGVPIIMFNEFVYYKKSIFKEYNLQVPKTWDEFIKVAETIKKGNKYIPILMGGKDAWPDYPFNEFMPAQVSNDGFIWNTMATQDEPFTKDKPFYQSYVMIKQLYDSKPFGPDPLGAGFDQVKTMFGTKGAMIAAGAWLYQDIKKAVGGDMSDVGTFFLPVRKNASDKLNTITMVDEFFATPKDGKNLAASKDFINWFTAKEWYEGYIKERGVSSTMNGIKAELDPVFKEAYSAENVNYVVYDGGGAEYNRIAAAVKFDVKKMGQDMMAGKDLDKMMDDLNKAWKSAKASK